MYAIITTILLLILVILVLFLIIIFLSSIYANWQTAPWVPTPLHDVKRLLKLADIKPGQKVYDLGCGDGRLIVAAAQKGAIAEGFEISFLPYLLSKIRLSFQKNTINARIRYKDFWQSNLNDADIVYFYLMPKIYPKLQRKFESELKKGTKVISYVWPMDGWQPISVDIEKGRPNLYLYQI